VAAEASRQDGWEVELIDLADFDLPLFDEPLSPRFNPKRPTNAGGRRFLEKMAWADGYIVVTPEYNHSVPAALKNALDYLDFQATKKPFAIVSQGTVGGARAAEHLKGIIIEVGAAVVPKAIALQHAKDLIDADGHFQTGSPLDYGQEKQLENMLAELDWWTVTLKAGRLDAVLA
jgi:NAD(P)H-dependent FMN reductase